MDESMKKTRERLMDEFRQASSAEKWTKDCVEMMKNLLKAIYYIDVISAMDEGNEYPGSEYMPGSGNSYARGRQNRNSMGQYTRSGTYPMNYMNSYNNGYRNNMSGRRYYDDEMGNIVHKLEHMMDNEMNPEKRMALQDIIGELQM